MSVGNLVKAFCLIAVSYAVSGCDPDEIRISMNVSDIVKAQNGEEAYARAKIVYSTMGMDDEDDKAKLERCRNVAQKYVGKNGRVKIVKDEFKTGIDARFKIPIFNSSKPCRFSLNPPLNMVIDKNCTMLCLHEEEGVVDRLNADLSRAADMVEAGFVGKTSFVIHNDTEHSFSFDVIGAFVDGEAVLTKRVVLAEDEECEIMFPRKNGENHVYNKINPRIINFKIVNGQK